MWTPSVISQEVPAAYTLSRETVSIEAPPLIIAGLESEFTIRIDSSLAHLTQLDISINGEPARVALSDGTGSFSLISQKGKRSVEVVAGAYKQEIPIRPMPLWLSVLPPLIAILMALIFREVVVSLFFGTFLGAGLLKIYSGASIFKGLGTGFLAVLDEYILEALNDSGHLSIIVFSLLIGGMVSVISRNGGMNGVVGYISRYARTAKSGQLATWALGIAIFFDDYANTLVVGNTMRSVTDRLKISREKLSYIVDSTAAPVAALAFITTWIGAELGYIESGIRNLAGFPEGLSPYAIFLSSLKYSFYPVLTLIFILMLILTGRDFGPMLKAERRSRGLKKQDSTEDGAAPDMDEFSPESGIQHRAFNAIIPVLTLIFVTLAGLLYTGWSDQIWDDPGMGFFRKLSAIVGASDSYAALLWASLSAVTVAVLLTSAQRIMPLDKAMHAVTTGFKAMMPALIILTLAWALAAVTDDMHTADFLTRLFSGAISPYWIPLLTFLLGAIISFSTGSSWGTMAILYPLMIPAIWKISLENGLPVEETLPLLYNVVASVLAGSVLGDHCSPISDTTILSSLASSCNHIDHVRTQLPYALTVGIVGMMAGTLPSSLGFPVWAAFPVAIAFLYGVIRILGKRPSPIDQS
jgi:Na+/H+ antiporter NhaC